MISIIIPVFNGEKYLAQCIQSCVDQLYEDIEIIIVDDGSTDRSYEIAMRYRDNYPGITVIKKSNGGTASALNAGIKNMKGSWFKWLSADDRFNSKHALQNMMSLISIIPQHEKFIFYTHYVIIDENSKPVKTFYEPERANIGTDYRNVELLHNFYGNASSSLIHKKIINEVGLFKKLPYGEDLEYWLSACLKWGFTTYLLQLKSIDYRVHSDSITSTKNQTENEKFVNQLREEYYPLLTDKQKEYLKELRKTTPLRRKIIPIGMRAKLLKLRGKFK